MASTLRQQFLRAKLVMPPKPAGVQQAVFGASGLVPTLHLLRYRKVRT
jgi:hypothetical protein